jgi:hypothetical protein
MASRFSKREHELLVQIVQAALKKAGNSVWMLLLAVACLAVLTGCEIVETRPTASHVIALENSKTGTSDWIIRKAATNHEIEGFASRTSVNPGQDISFYVSTSEASYSIEIFRMGWYGGTGARRMTSPIVLDGHLQPIPVPDAATHLIECHWADPYLLHIPASGWVSGVYLALLTTQTNGLQSYIVFVVRDDARSSALLFQSSVTTYQAYNDWRGWSLYTHPRAYAVSFNRPYKADHGAGEFLGVAPRGANRGGWEYSMIRFLEREGYDVSYATDVDLHEHPNLLSNHRGFFSVGHDEYWSWEMRNNVEGARSRGMNLGFFGANAAFFQVRFARGANGDEDRNIICYKDAALDPVSSDPTRSFLTTVEFRQSPVNRPEDELIGVMWEAATPVDEDIVIADASSWVFANTGLRDGDHLAGLLGYEIDRLHGHAPTGTRLIAHSLVPNQGLFSDMTTYQTHAGGTVFATGSMQWNYGLDDFAPSHRLLTNAQAQQITRNVLARFGIDRSDP